MKYKTMNAKEENSLYRLLQVDANLQQEPQPESKAEALRNLYFELRFSSFSKDSGCVRRHVLAEYMYMQFIHVYHCLRNSVMLQSVCAFFNVADKLVYTYNILLK